MASVDQVLFLVDTCRGEGGDEGEDWSRSVYLSCCRILLSHFSSGNTDSIPREDFCQSDSIKWSYELLTNSKLTSNKKSNSFFDLKADLVNSFYEDLSNHAHPKSPLLPAKVLYSGLGGCVQNYHWDTPMIMTPLLQKKKKGKPTRSCDSHVTNHIYMFSNSLSNQIMDEISYKRNFIDEIFTPALVEQLLSKKIFLHVIWPPSKIEQNRKLFELLQSKLQTFNGNVIPLSALVAPPITMPTGLALPPSAILSRDYLSMNSVLYHLLYDIDGSILCVLLISPLTTPTAHSNFMEVGVAKLRPISTIRGIPFHHYSFDNSSICIGIVPNQKFEQMMTTPTFDSSEPAAVTQSEARHCHGNHQVLSGRFENLCLWLSRNDLSLLLSFESSSGTTQVVMLQPTTPLTATLTFILPEYMHLYITNNTITLNNLSTDITDDITNTVTVPTSDVELYTTVVELSSQYQTIDNSGDIWSSLLCPPNEVSFDCIMLSHWSYLTPKYGIPSLKIEELKDNGHVTDSSGHASSREMLTQLQQEYTLTRFIGQCYHDNEPPIIGEEEQRTMNIDELLDDFKSDYMKVLPQLIDSISIFYWVRENVEKLVTLSLKSVTCEAPPVTMETMEAELQKLLSFVEESLRDGTDKEIIKNKHVFVILLYLELIRHQVLPVTDDIINKLVLLFQKLPLISSPTIFGELLKEIIVPEYSTTCKSVIKQIFDKLMLSLPPCLSPESESYTTSPGNESTQSSENENEADNNGPVPMPDTNSATKPKKRSLTRHTSLQGITLNRQISVARKHKSVTGESESKKVRRSLFSRSVSVSRIDRRKGENKTTPIKDQGAAIDKFVEVNETPVKKQVDNYRIYKLQRYRSKHSINDMSDVTVVEESPQRSFYAKLKTNPAPVKFVTPPSQSNSPSVNKILNKHPSPAVLHSLLHGDWASPPSQTPPSTHPSLPERSPELFSDSYYSNTLPDTTQSLENPLSPTRTRMTPCKTLPTRMTPCKTLPTRVTPCKTPPTSMTPCKTPPTRMTPCKTPPTRMMPCKTPPTLHQTPPTTINSLPTTPLRSILRTPDKATPTKSIEKRKYVTFEPEEDSCSRMAFELSTPTKKPNDDFRSNLFLCDDEF